MQTATSAPTIAAIAAILVVAFGTGMHLALTGMAARRWARAHTGVALMIAASLLIGMGLG